MSVEPCLGDETLVAVLDATAGAEVRAQVERHTSHCTACRELLSTLAKQTTPGDATEPAAAAPPEPLPDRIGRYVITGELGAGGMGVVYTARDPELDRTVALKLLRGDAASAALQPRLRREAQALAQLVHANVVTVYDAGTHDDRIFIAMEHVDGETLARWERAHSPREVLATYVAAGRGLAAAHAAGIIHRDFKPDNVLIGRDGRVRVADFGLARAAGTPLPSMPPSGEPVSPIAPTTPAASALTEDGALVGTPYYIAPELYSGGEADARSDQYSFCVALSTALSRGRARAAASRRVRTALARGLSKRPEQRFASMDALLACLSGGHRARVAVALGAAAVAVAAVGVVALRPSAEPPCARAGDGMAQVWSPLQRANVDGALARTHLPYAAATGRELARVLDRYAADWRTMREGACEATRERGEQSAELLDLRMQCLDERRRAVGQLVEVIAAGEPEAIARAVAAANGLPAIADCADARALASPVRPPSPQVAARAAALADELAATATLRAAGDYARALADAQRVLGEARALGYRPLEALAALELGRSLGVVDRDREAQAAEQSALLAAEAGRDDRTRALVLIELTLLVGHDLAQPDQAATLRAQAAAALERLDHPPLLEAALLEVSGQVAEDAGSLDDAERDQRAALARYERIYGRDDLQLADPLRRLAHVHILRMHAAEARTLLERTQAIEERVLGGDHPDLAVTLSMLAGALYELHDYDRAVALHRRAIATIEHALGPESLMLAAMLHDLAAVYQWQGHAEAAVAVHRRAVAIATKHLGAEHVRTLRMRETLASALEDLDRHTEALAELVPVLAAQRAQLGDHQDTALTLHMTAHVELGLGRYAAARDHAREALAMAERVLGPTYHPVDELITLGHAQLELGEAAQAVDALTRARSLAGDEQDPSTVAWLEALLGRALKDSGRDPARGLALVRSARARLAADERAAENVRMIDSWAKAHR